MPAYSAAWLLTASAFGDEMSVVPDIKLQNAVPPAMVPSRDCSSPNCLSPDQMSARQASPHEGTAQDASTIAAASIRRIIIEQSFRAGVGHIGSALSIADIVASLYTDVLRIENPEDPNRDIFILSKGHAALALYAALHVKGWLSFEQLNSFCTNKTLLGVHPEHRLRGIEFSSGSLGHALSYAVGIALGAKRRNEKRRVYVLLSDAECNEGSVWEAVMFAAHHELNNLVVIVDDNKQQAFGYTRDVLNLNALDARWRTFGWHAQVVDGHDCRTLTQNLAASEDDKQPRVVIAQTVFGNGVSFMQSQIEWHYMPLSEKSYVAAMQELSRRAE